MLVREEKSRERENLEKERDSKASQGKTFIFVLVRPEYLIGSSKKSI